MLWNFFEFLLQLELAWHNVGQLFVKPLILVWNNLWVEWLMIQSLVLYAIYRIYTTSNPLRQVMAIMWLVVLLCLYLSLWQFELFACFLFLGEFTIMIFFYCLFLHLKTAVTSSTLNNKVNSNSLILATTSILSFSVLPHAMLYSGNTSDVLNVLINLYPTLNDFNTSDLIFLYYFFVSANVSVHVLIGITLFILTIFLFITVLLYTSINLSKQSAYRTASIKLFTTKGYYEQTAITTQKFFNKG